MYMINKRRSFSSPCSLICLICFTVSFRMAHLSGLTLRSSMSLMLAKISSASSSMYLFSCSRFLRSLLLLGLEWRQRRYQNTPKKKKQSVKIATSCCASSSINILLINPLETLCVSLTHQPLCPHHTLGAQTTVHVTLTLTRL